MTWRSVLVQAVVDAVLALLLIGGLAAVAWFHFRPTPPVPPAPPAVISLPATVTAPVGVLTKISVECTGTFKSWTNLCKCSDVEQVGSEMWIVPHKPGTYDLIVWTCKDGPSEAGVCVVTAGEPIPPVPPDPPVPPTPPSPLTAQFQTAFEQDKDTDKTKSLAFLQSAYKGMAAQAPSRSEQTNAAFVAWMKTVVEAPGIGLSIGQVRSLRTAIAAELLAAWGAMAAPLTAADAAKELQKIADALQGVK